MAFAWHPRIAVGCGLGLGYERTSDEIARGRVLNHDKADCLVSRTRWWETTAGKVVHPGSELKRAGPSELAVESVVISCVAHGLSGACGLKARGPLSFSFAIGIIIHLV